MSARVSSLHRSAIVTGSARRVGRLLAAGLIDAGWRVIIHARSVEAAGQTAHELGAAGSVGADVADPGDCERLVREAMEQLGTPGLDLLMNAASAFEAGDPLATDAPRWDAEFAVTARAPLLVTRAAHPYLLLARAREAGALPGLVINVSDRAAREHWTGRMTHAAAKAALESVTLSCAKAFAPDVRVAALAPGNVLPPEGREDMAVDTPPELLVAAILAMVDDSACSGEIRTW